MTVWISNRRSDPPEAETGRRGLPKDEAGDILAQPEAAFMIDPGVHAAVDTAEPGLSRRRAVARERPDDTMQHI